ncbi:mercuric ion transport protein [Geothermobacter ehrlichii]|uniref:Mercuric transport protein MerT n=1 Tax=Geothermobacter ehrlichii TaxID=213224 RepID=A0A5D3WHN8_9BACT|nr:mercuric transporter MerT family protein [Geothermobacter ehrlichii]TYO97606.1 mercuric ion transport protein [Geothermobacter ehrlichii]
MNVSTKQGKLAGLGLIGAIISGFLASGCCIGPLLLVFLGIGSAGALSAFEPWRPIMMALTFLFLGLAFYLTYREPKAAGCADAACDRVGRKRFRKLLLWIVTLFSLALLFTPQIMPLLLD